MRVPRYALVYATLKRLSWPGKYTSVCLKYIDLSINMLSKVPRMVEVANSLIFAVITNSSVLRYYTCKTIRRQQQQAAGI